MSEFLKEYKRTMKIASRFKAVMVKKGLTEARAVCPRCQGDLRGFISGRKDHFRMSCKGTCKMFMME
jgi:hypothetical protein